MLLYAWQYANFLIRHFRSAEWLSLTKEERERLGIEMKEDGEFW